MPDTVGSLIRHAVMAACVGLAWTTAAAAQTSPTARSTSPVFMSRYDFHLSAASLDIADERFSWDTHFGGEIDVVDYGAGRLTAVADYEAMLGNEFRPFDPNQSNYLLEASASARVHGTEIAGLFHHMSRHLGDRAKRFAVDWNVIGARVSRRFDVAGLAVDVRGGAGGVVEHSYVDYTWTADLDLRAIRPVGPRVGVFAAGRGEVYGVDGSIPDRGHVASGRAEAGVRLNGRAGAVELFVGVEQRADAYPIDFQTERWALAGFRIVSR